MRYFHNQPHKKNAVAYCHNPSHLGYLSPAIMKDHQCMQKHCKYLHIYKDNPYWVRKDKAKQGKKFRKWLENDDWEKISEYIAELIGRRYE